jgi:hypothetical protein
VSPHQERSTLRVAIALASGAGLAASALVACSLALNFDGIDDGVRDEPEGGPSIDAQTDGASPPLDATTTDAPAPADAPVSVTDAATDAPAGDASCPTTLPGPTFVRAGGVCIDATEITVAEYTAFLTAMGGTTDVTGQPALCSPWNTSLAPFGWPPGGATDVPVGNANWCQAWLYCHWAGKHLCGAPDGGSGNAYGWTDPTQSVWYGACSHDGLDGYPYGSSYEPTVCNGADYGADAATASLATCTGGYAGLFDMSGNVFEWEDSCAGEDGGANTGPNDYCHTRGGSYTSPAAILACNDGTAYSRNSQAPFVGFRCCSP